jgi:protoheme IX farnesyltransferase
MTNILIPSKEHRQLNFLLLKIYHYCSLLKPRVMYLAIFTSLVGMLIAPGQLLPLDFFLVILAISIGSGAAGALNMWYEKDTDKLMERTKNRVLPLGLISSNGALSFGIFLSIISIVLLYFSSNLFSAGLLGLTIFYYVFIYTIWLKKITPQNIVIGGAAGAFPPMIGWSAVTGSLSIEIFVIFLLIFLWTPPHFWSLALYKSEDYKKAGIPMMPLVVGKKSTVNMIIYYSLSLVVMTLILSFYYSLFFTILGLALSSIFVYLSMNLKRFVDDQINFERKAQNLFYFSIIYLFNIFSIILVDNLLWNHL